MKTFETNMCDVNAGCRSKGAGRSAADGQCCKTPKAKRPSLGSLFWVAATSWGSVLVAEQLAWSNYAVEMPGGDNVGNYWVLSGCLVLMAVLVAGFIIAAQCLRKNRVGYDSRVADTNAVLDDTSAARAAHGVSSGISLRKKSAIPHLLLFLPVVAVFACSLLYWSAWEADIAWLGQSMETRTLEVELVSDPAQRDYGLVSVARAAHGARYVSMRIIWPKESGGERAGHKVVVTGSYRTPRDDASGRWNHQQGLLGSIKVSECSPKGYASGLRGLVAPLRDRSMERISELGQPSSDLLAGVLLGDKTLYAGTELEQDFKTTGLAHLMAVSGTHLAVVMMLAGWVLSRMPIPRAARAFLVLLLLIGYVALTAFSPSAMRAFVMCAVGLSAFALQRRRHLVSSLALCVLLFLGIQPNLAFSLSLILSVLCMVGILIFTPLVGTWLKLLLPGRAQGAADAIAATLASSVLTFPVCLPMFAQLPLISPLSTMLVSPFVTLLVGLGVPALLMTGPLELVGNALLFAAGLVASVCAKLVHALADIPFACLPLDSQAPMLAALCVLGTAVLWAMWPMPNGNKGKAGSTRRAAALTGLVFPLLLVAVTGFGNAAQGVPFLTSALSQDTPQVVMLDVGQGDSMLIRDGDAAVLVDTGEEGDVLLRALARHGVTRLDAVLLSHKDADHTGALSALVGVVEVKHVYIHADLLSAPSCEKVRKAASWASRQGTAEGVCRGDSIRVGRFKLFLLGPEQGGDSENEDSLVWLLGFSGSTGAPELKGLLTGDGEEAAIASVLDEAGDIDFLKVGHHGSAGAVSDEEMRTLKPELSLISVGADNDYGHPTQQTLGVLERAGSKVLRTDLSGDISLSFMGGQLRVSCQKK